MLERPTTRLRNICLIYYLVLELGEFVICLIRSHQARKTSKPSARLSRRAQAMSRWGMPSWEFLVNTNPALSVHLNYQPVVLALSWISMYYCHFLMRPSLAIFRYRDSLKL